MGPTASLIRMRKTGRWLQEIERRSTDQDWKTRLGRAKETVFTFTMKTRPLSRSVLLLASISALAAGAFFPNRATAVEPAPVLQQGLQILLSASAYEVRPAAVPPSERTLTAFAQLTNRSRTTVGFEFPSEYAATQIFRFRLLDSSGEQLWSSDQHVRVIPGLTPRDLDARRSWRRSSQIPLEFEGQPLPVGIYTLEATVTAEPQVSATTVFKVVAGTQPPTSRKVLVASVDEVTARLIPTFAPPTEVLVEAEGFVSTGGWSAPELRLRNDAQDGYLEFDFVARPPAPGSIVTQAFQRVTASRQVPVPTTFVGIRVHAQGNTKTIVAP